MYLASSLRGLFLTQKASLEVIGSSRELAARQSTRQFGCLGRAYADSFVIRDPACTFAKLIRRRAQYFDRSPRPEMRSCTFADGWVGYPCGPCHCTYQQNGGVTTEMSNYTPGDIDIICKDVFF